MFASGIQRDRNQRKLSCYRGDQKYHPMAKFLALEVVNRQLCGSDRMGDIDFERFIVRCFNRINPLIEVPEISGRLRCCDCQLAGQTHRVEMISNLQVRIFQHQAQLHQDVQMLSSRHQRHSEVASNLLRLS